MCERNSDFIDDGAKCLGVAREQFCEFLELFLEVSRRDIELMRHAISVDDRIGVASAAHSIKGAAVVLNLAPIVKAAIIAEDLARIGDLGDVRAILETIATERDVLKGFLQMKSDAVPQVSEVLAPILGDQDGE